MKAIPFLNILISLFYIIVSILLGYVLKRSCGTLKVFQKFAKHQKKLHSQPNISEQNQGLASKDNQIHSKLLIVKAWFKKYTLIGSIINQDKKYLLKQFVFISGYSVASLQINHFILWPVALSFCILPCIYICLEIVNKKCNDLQKSMEEENKGKIKPEHQIESEIEIQSVNLQISSNNGQKSYSLVQRSNFQIIIIATLSFAAFAMFMRTIFYLTNSVSNSGQLNVISFLIAIGIDQFGVRIPAGLFVLSGLTLIEKITNVSLDQVGLYAMLCDEEIRDRLIVIEEELKKKQKENSSLQRQRVLTISATKKVAESEINQSNSKEKQILNLLEMQPTKRSSKFNQQGIGLQNQEVFDCMYLTTAEKKIFENEIQSLEENKIEENKSHLETKRKGKDDKNNCFSAQKIGSVTIQSEELKKGYDDMIILKNNPLEELEMNHDENTYGNLYIGQSPKETKRRHHQYKLKKHKRNLQLSGSSPYLEYLPNMLKKDKTNKTQGLKDKRM